MKLTASRFLINLEEARTTITSVRTSDDPSSQSDSLPPFNRMNPHITGNHWNVEVVSSLCFDIHVASKHLMHILSLKPLKHNITEYSG